jgi:hypothetical protein
MFDQLSADILASLIKGFPTTTTTTTTTTKQNVDPAVYYVYSRVKKWEKKYLMSSLVPLWMVVSGHSLEDKEAVELGLGLIRRLKRRNIHVQAELQVVHPQC